VKVSNVNDLWGKEFMDVALGVEAKLTSITRGNVVVANNKKTTTITSQEKHNNHALNFFAKVNGLKTIKNLMGCETSTTFWNKLIVVHE
jgi:ribosomal 30S subunit maturation factor RimM